jgi:hypothetical protein
MVGIVGTVRRDGEVTASMLSDDILDDRVGLG